ncbi:ABC transporter ATP-binding protein [Microlunatus parietis]|uniref:Multiple sugar transport system ATP-binding protein n=1 Tax=Microlunatus parietis TaxID=682979 RepID=A0A7Y9IDE3_9ACTN|nr:ABC transporter ATP-binding protein [Microlunatus parietis]NYE74526.1 multiple sugar transport system ATP-binding protein [Microlunatus parietis]
MAGLRVDRLVKRLGNQLAVDDVTFEVAEGEFFVLLGSSGCGKTTTLRTICGIEQPDSGRIVIADRDVTALPSRERNLGMVFQEYGLYPSMDVLGNIAYGLQARGGLPKSEIERRVVEAAEKLGLTPLLRTSIVDLSGGEQQRVALGRAMVKDADAYLYDEPLSNLDPKLRHRMRRDIQDLHRAKQKATLYVTHDQTEAFALADRIGVMAEGRLHQVGTAEDLIESPATTFVASFVGTPPMNLLAGELHNVDGELGVQCAGVRLPVPPAAKVAIEDHGRTAVIVGIRPDGLTITGTEAATISATIADVEPLIGQTIIRARIGGDATVSALLDGDTGDHLSTGQVVRLGVSAEISLFDPDTGSALAS